MLNAIIVSNYWGVFGIIVLLMLSSFLLGSASGYDAHIRDEKRHLMSREWSMRNHPTYKDR